MSLIHPSSSDDEVVIPHRITVAQEKIAVQLLTRTLEASDGGNSNVDPASGPLCLRAFQTGMTFLTVQDVDGKLPAKSHRRFEEFANDHPKFINAAVSWALNRASDDNVRRVVDDLLPCSCDRSDSWIHMLHYTAERTDHSEQECLMRLGTRVFGMIMNLLTQADFQTLSKVSKKERVKQKRKVYEALSYYVVDNPRTLVQSTASWYKIAVNPTAMQVLSEYITLQTPDLEHSLMVLDPELPLLILKRMVEIMNISQSRGVLADDMLDESMRTLCIIMSLSSDSLLTKECITTILGPHAKTIYSLLISIVSVPDAQVRRWDRSGAFSSSVFPGFGVVAMNVHEMFGRSHKLGKLKPRVNELFPGLKKQVDTMRYTGLLHAMSRFRDMDRCANFVCGKKQPSPTQAFKRCSRCGILSYCSPEYQRTAWSHPEYSHKSLCKYWASVKTIWPRNPELVSEAGTAHLLVQGKVARNAPRQIVVNEYLKELAVPVGLTEDVVGKVHEDSLRFDSKLRVDMEI